jgi:hypothetical protein
VNAVPGLTDTSLFPLAAEASGLSFEQACERIVEPGAAANGGTRALVPAGGEVLRSDLIEEVLELLDDLLGVFDLVLELDR